MKVTYKIVKHFLIGVAQKVHEYVKTLVKTWHTRQIVALHIVSCKNDVHNFKDLLLLHVHEQHAGHISHTLHISWLFVMQWQCFEHIKKSGLSFSKPLIKIVMFGKGTCDVLNNWLHVLVHAGVLQQFFVQVLLFFHRFHSCLTYGVPDFTFAQYWDSFASSTLNYGLSGLRLGWILTG